MGEELEDLGAMDAMLLDLAAAGVSSAEISERTGGALSPVRVEARIREIIRDRNNSLSIAEQQYLVIHDIQKLKAHAWSYVEAGGEDGAAAMGHLVRALKLLSERIDAQMKYVDDRDAQITKKQAKQWIQVMELVYESVVERLAKAYPDVDVIVLRDMVNEELPAAFEQIEALSQAHDG